MSEDMAAPATEQEAPVAAPAEAPAAPASETPAPSDIAHEIEGGLEDAGVNISAKAEEVIGMVMKVLDFVAKDLVPAKDSASYAEFQAAVQLLVEGELSVEKAALKFKDLFSGK